MMLRALKFQIQSFLLLPRDYVQLATKGWRGKENPLPLFLLQQCCYVQGIQNSAVISYPPKMNSWTVEVNFHYFCMVILNEYTLQLQLITEVLLKALVARSLNSKENCFYDQHGEQSIVHGRFNFYPSSSRPWSDSWPQATCTWISNHHCLADKEVDTFNSRFWAYPFPLLPAQEKANWSCFQRR